MGRVKKIVLWGLIGCFALSVLGLYAWDRIWRSPEYVLTRLTPPYEQEAAAFFEENRAALQSLVAAQSGVGRGERLCYAFHYGQYNSPQIPPEAERILRDLEVNTPENYTVTFSDREIVIDIASGTHYDVRLCRAYDYDGGSRQKTTPLEDEWEVRAYYVIRH